MWKVSRPQIALRGQELADFDAGFFWFRRPSAKVVHLRVVHAKGGGDQDGIVDFPIRGEEQASSGYQRNVAGKYSLIKSS